MLHISCKVGHLGFAWYVCFQPYPWVVSGIYLYMQPLLDHLGCQAYILAPHAHVTTTTCIPTSISFDGDHPDLVNICIHILPPTVMWPTYMYNISVTYTVHTCLYLWETEILVGWPSQMVDSWDSLLEISFQVVQQAKNVKRFYYTVHCQIALKNRNSD